MLKDKARKKRRWNKLSRDEWSYCLYYFGYQCCICGETKKLQADHWIARCKGGSSQKNNIVPICPECNVGKGASPALGWLTLKFRDIGKAREIVTYVEQYFSEVSYE